MVLLTAKNKKVVVNLKTDICLYDAPHNPPNTGTRYTSGTDYYAHKARSGNVYYYSYSWSMWQGTNEHYELVEPENMRLELIRLAGLPYPAELSDNEIELANEYFPGIFNEDA